MGGESVEERGTRKGGTEEKGGMGFGDENIDKGIKIDVQENREKRQGGGQRGVEERKKSEAGGSAENG